MESRLANFDAVTTSGAVLGQILVKLRLAKTLKQGEVAAAVGVSASTWSRIEKGDSGISIEQLRLAAKALSVTPGQIFELLDAAEDDVKKNGVRIATNIAGVKVDSLTAIGSTTAGAIAGITVGSAIPIIGPALGAMIGPTLGAIIGDVMEQSKRKPEE